MLRERIFFDNTQTGASSVPPVMGKDGWRKKVMEPERMRRREGVER
jgi:hypothetical protein